MQSLDKREYNGAILSLSLSLQSWIIRSIDLLVQKLLTQPYTCVKSFSVF